jgi:hypothetical protein
VAVRELVVAIPAPRCDHRQHEAPAISQQLVIDVRVVVCDLLGRVGQVELDGPPAARLEVDEKRAGPGQEQVARMGFAVQELLGPVALADRSSQAVQRTGEEGPVRVGQLRCPGLVGHERPGLGNPVREMHGGQVDRAHSGVQTFERAGVLRVRDRLGGHRFVVGPQGDRIVVADKDLGRFQCGHRAPGLGQPLSDIHFELGVLVCRRRDPGQHVAGLQTQGELVRVVQDGGVAGGQPER